MCEEGMVQLDA
jgi:hypothetical protein